jgi:phage recombination protein Bet
LTNGTVATIGQGAALAIRPGQEMWTDKQRAALGVLGIKDATNADLAVFMHYCQKTGLDPFSRQIYMICRREKQGDQWVNKQTIQVGIDGFRVIRDRIAAKLGIAVEYEDTIWYDGGGNEHAVWLYDEPPVAARVVVLKDGRRYPGVVRTAAYMQRNKQGDPVGQWKTQPDHMIEKCAEAFALRRAFPHDLGGIYIDEETAAMPRQYSQPVTAAEVIGHATPANHIPDVPSADAPSPPAPAEGTAGPGPDHPAAGPGPADLASSGQRSAIKRELDRLGIEGTEERVGVLSRLARREVDGASELTQDEAGTVTGHLKSCATYQDLVKLTMAGDKPDSDG